MLKSSSSGTKSAQRPQLNIGSLDSLLQKGYIGNRIRSNPHLTFHKCRAGDELRVCSTHGRQESFNYSTQPNESVSCWKGNLSCRSLWDKHDFWRKSSLQHLVCIKTRKNDIATSLLNLVGNIFADLVSFDLGIFLVQRSIHGCFNDCQESRKSCLIL